MFFGIFILLLIALSIYMCRTDGVAECVVIWIVLVMMGALTIPVIIDDTGYGHIDRIPVYTNEATYYIDGTGQVLVRTREASEQFKVVEIESIVPFASHGMDLETSELWEEYRKIDTGYMWIPIDIEYDNKDDVEYVLYLREGDTLEVDRSRFVTTFN